MSFHLGGSSRLNLAGVAPRLVQVVERAIEITDQDFAVWEGARSLAAQKRNIAKGVSWTINSKHLIQADGYAHAVDLVPWVNGAPVWEWPRCYVVAVAMSVAAEELGVPILWGGVWDRQMSAYGQGHDEIRAASQRYVVKRKAAGKRAAIDGPHFELA